MKPEYNFQKDEFGNVLFLDYSKHGNAASGYNYRWVWVNQKESNVWQLIPHPFFAPSTVDLLAYEIELAQRAYEEISKESGV